jgi:hypothetical protein
MYINSNGDVGIGTTSPLSATNYRFVTVQGGSNGGGYSIYNSSGSESARFQAAPDQIVMLNYSGASALPFTWSTGSSELMRLTYGGYVGIGTNNPSCKLDVVDSGSTSARVYAGAGGANMYIVAASSNANLWLNSSGGSGHQYAVYSATDGALGFYDTTASSERMRIDSSGNVGVGTASPGSKLDVSSSGQNIVISRANGGFAAFQSLMVQKLRVSLEILVILPFPRVPLLMNVCASLPAATWGLGRLRRAISLTLMVSLTFEVAS